MTVYLVGVFPACRVTNTLWLCFFNCVNTRQQNTERPSDRKSSQYYTAHVEPEDDDGETLGKKNPQKNKSFCLKTNPCGNIKHVGFNCNTTKRQILANKT